MAISPLRKDGIKDKQGLAEKYGECNCFQMVKNQRVSAQ
tara:strand:+ start:476 stop:592 length:117 start_codon:yes stop_codon:yes gene_type:complete